MIRNYNIAIYQAIKKCEYDNNNNNFERTDTDKEIYREQNRK